MMSCRCKVRRLVRLTDTGIARNSRGSESKTVIGLVSLHTDEVQTGRKKVAFHRFYKGM